MKAKPMKVLRELAQMGNAGEEMMRSAYPKMRGEDFDPSMLEGIIDITELPQMYKELDEEVIRDSKLLLGQYRVIYLDASTLFVDIKSYATV